MTEKQTDDSRPAEPKMNRGCWLTGAFLVLLFATPCVVPYLYWKSGETERESQLQGVREVGDAHCMALWKLVEDYRRQTGGFPQDLTDLRDAPEAPQAVRDVSGGIWGDGRYFRILYSFDDPRALIGSSAIRRRWTSRRGRWTEFTLD